MSKKRHMDEFLKEVFKQFIAIKDSDYKKAQTIFIAVFEQVKKKMGEQDNYFSKYSNQVMNAGSVYDGIKVGKLDEFDTDIVIRLPISYDDGENGIIIEPHKPGFVKMKITNAFDHLDKTPGWEKCHVVTREWRDDRKYFLQSKFRQWMHGIVQKALTSLDNKVVVNDVTYLLTYRSSGPAFNLIIKNDAGGEPFSLDVDLVPVIRFQLPRWPKGYRSSGPAFNLIIKNDAGGEPFSLDVDLVPVIRFQLPRWPKGYRKQEGSQVKDWLVVPKPLKDDTDEVIKSRCWRLAFHEFEREMMKGCDNLKVVIRLMKKLRDAQFMKKIASYYIKTLFLWEIHEKQDKKYWQNKVTILLLDMVEKFHTALENNNIPYFWQKQHNLIEHVKPTVLKLYQDKLKSFINRLKSNDIDGVVSYLLTEQEVKEFKDSDFYKSFPPQTQIETPTKDISRSNSTTFNGLSHSESSSQVSQAPKTTEELLNELLKSHNRLESKLESINSRIEKKIDTLTERVDRLCENVSVLDMMVKTKL